MRKVPTRVAFFPFASVAVTSTWYVVAERSPSSRKRWLLARMYVRPKASGLGIHGTPSIAPGAWSETATVKVARTLDSTRIDASAIPGSTSAVVMHCAAQPWPAFSWPDRRGRRSRRRRGRGSRRGLRVS
ncbi:MAG: hypothetical protein R3C15_13415 [Thermoleophilia bacterium]